VHPAVDGGQDGQIHGNREKESKNQEEQGMQGFVLLLAGNSVATQVLF
jgi:hypothetical protein